MKLFAVRVKVDFLFPSRRGGLRMVECKASKTVHPAMAHSLLSLRWALNSAALVQMAVVHRPSATGPKGKALSPGADALDVRPLWRAF